MLEAYQTGEDIHAKTARLVFGAKTDKELKEKRRVAKIVNFAIAYAVEAYGLSTRVGLSRAEAKQVIADYFETYKGIRKAHDEIPETAAKAGIRYVDVRPPSLLPFDQRSQLHSPFAGRARGDQHADPGNGERHRKDRDASGA